ncbi:unnamed protein product [Rhizopus microsporus]
MFSAVLLQIELTDHRTFFRTYPYTFTTDEAIKVMSSLQFIHVHRQPDPSDPSRQISTRTTTTFSMDTTTAKSMIQYFLSARLIMNATDPNNWTVKDKGLWCPTLKGKYTLEEFADYTQVEMKNSLIAALNAPYMVPSVSGSTGGRIIKLDRLTDHDDQITFSRANMTIAFKAMLASLPLDALVLDDVGGIDRKNLSRYQYTFLGTQCVEWLADRLTVSSKEEAEMVASEFVLFGWIGLVVDKSDKSFCVNEDGISFKTSRFAIYYVTERGLVIAGWKPPQEEAIQQASDISFTSETSSSSKSSMIKQRPSPQSSINRSHRHVDEEGPSSAAMSRSSSLGDASEQLATMSISKEGAPLRPPSMSLTDSSMSHGSVASKDTSHYTRLHHILDTPLLRMYFRDFLRANYCEENINYWVDHDRLIRNFKLGTLSALDQLAECYAVYEMYLSPDAKADVNIDHMLHREILNFINSVFIPVPHLPSNTKVPYFTTLPATTVTKPLGPCDRLLLLPPQVSVKQRTIVIRGLSPDRCLTKLLGILSRVNDHLCKVMAEDSVPKFIKTRRYKDLMTHQQSLSPKEQSIEDSQIEILTTLSSSTTPSQRLSLDEQRHEIQA